MEITGHRGARDERPENTLAGFQHIVDLGIKAAELDIHLSSDGHLMVFHDETLDRTTNGTGPLKHKSRDELQRLDAGDGEKIPTLPEVLNLLLTHNFQVQIEIKDPDTVTPLITYLESLSAEQLSLLIVISFDHRTILKVKEALPSLRTTAILYGYPLDPCSLVNAAKANGLSINIEFIDEELVKRLKERNYTLTVWNANTKEQWEKMRTMDIDYLCTDVPSKIIEWSKD